MSLVMIDQAGVEEIMEKIERAAMATPDSGCFDATFEVLNSYVIQVPTCPDCGVEREPLFMDICLECEWTG